MAGPKLSPWQKSVARKLDDLLVRDIFINQLHEASEGRQLWMSFLDHFELPLSVSPVLWRFMQTKEIDYSLIDAPAISVVDEANNTIDGLPIDQVFGPNFKRKKMVEIWLDPDANKTETLAYISACWDEYIEPALSNMRGGNRAPIRSELNIKQKQKIMELSKTMKPKEIAHHISLTPKQISDIIYRERKKFRHLS